MSDFQGRRDAVLFAEARADLARRLLDERRRELASKAKRWVGPLALLSGLWVGWRIGLPSDSERHSHADDGAHPSAENALTSSRKRRLKPNTFGLWSLVLLGSRAAPVVLPLAVSWLDKRHAARSAEAGTPVALPTWLVALRGTSALLRR